MKSTKATRHTQADANQLERLLDKALRDLDVIREALLDEEDAERAAETADRAIDRVSLGLEQIAVRRTKRYLKWLDSRKHPA